MGRECPEAWLANTVERAYATTVEQTRAEEYETYPNNIAVAVYHNRKPCADAPAASVGPQHVDPTVVALDAR